MIDRYSGGEVVGSLLGQVPPRPDLGREDLGRDSSVGHTIWDVIRMLGTRMECYTHQMG